MKEQLLRLRGDRGTAGVAALGLLSVALVLNLFVLGPLEARSQSLKATLAAQAAKSGAQPARSGEKLAGVYDFLVTTFQAWKEYVDLQFIPLVRSLADRARIGRDSMVAKDSGQGQRVQGRPVAGPELRALAAP